MEHRLKTPIGEKEVSALRAGDLVWISGKVYTARDRVHALLASGEDIPVDLAGAVIYHCGPLIRDETILSAGPTTSGRVSRYTKDVVGRGVRLIVGKGGYPRRRRPSGEGPPISPTPEAAGPSRPATCW